MPASKTGNELIFTQAATQQLLINWFNDLQQRDHVKTFNGRLWRAELRRAQDLSEILTCEGYQALNNRLLKVMVTQSNDMLALAIFARVAAHISRENRQCSFAAQLGAEVKGRRCLSRMRFERLQQAKQPEEFCSQLIRAVTLRGDEGVNIISLADGIFLWWREWQAQEEHRISEINPFHRHRVRWASEYLLASEN